MRILFICLIFLCSFRLLGQTTAVTRISCRVNNPTDRQLFLTWKNTVLDEQESRMSYSISNGVEITNTWNISSPMIVGLWYNERRFDLYVEPGDNLIFTFEGQKFPESLAFQGKGSEHNNFLKSFFEVEKASNERIITYKINALNPLEFKTWIQSFYQKRVNLWAEYSKDLKSAFSIDFNNYLDANIEFWRAYHLLRFKTEREKHFSGGINLEIPTQYFDFLDQVNIDNENALLSSYYRQFIPLFLKYRDEFVESKSGISSTKLFVKSNFDGLEVFESPYSKEVVDFIPIGQTFMVLDKLSVGGGQYGSSLVYRMKIRYAGKEVWVKTTGWELLPEKSYNKNPLVVEDVRWKAKKMVSVAKVKMVGMRLLYEPYENGIVKELSLGEELIYLQQKTSEQFAYKLDSFSSVKDYFYKISTKDGLHTGWAPLMGLDISNVEMTDYRRNPRIEPSTRSDLNNLDYFFSGKPLIYAVATNIKQRLVFEPPSKLQKQYDAFLKLGADDKTKSELANVFYNSQLKSADVNAIAQVDEEVVVTRALNLYRPAIRFRLDEQQGLPKSKKAQAEEQQVIAVAAQEDKKVTDINVKPIAPYSLIKTTITGNIATLDKEELSFVSILDYLNLTEKRYAIELKSNNDFKFQLYLHEPMVGELIYGLDSIPVWAAPGDSIDIQVSGSSKNLTVSANGTGGSNIVFLRALRSYSKPMQHQLKMKIKQEEPDEFLSFLENKWREKKSFLDNFSGKSQFSPVFMQYANAEIDYWYGFNLLNYPKEHPLESIRWRENPSTFKVPDNYYDGLKNIIVQNENALMVRYYRYFLDENISDIKNKPENRGLDKVTIAKSNFQGKIQEYLIAKENILELKINMTNTNIDKARTFISNSKYPLFAEFMKNAIYADSEVKNEMQSPDFQLVNAKGESVSLSQYKGRLVYLDFWAPWCAPCLSNMKSSEMMKNQFSQNEIVFLYVNVDNNKAKWLQHLEDNVLDKNRHLFGFSPNPYILDISSVYKTQKLPSTFLINKEGKIVVNSTVRLEEQQMAATIKTYLR